MATQDELGRLSTELDRVVDRLNSMPLTRAAGASEAVYEVADELVAMTRELADDVPADAQPPRLAPQGLGSLLAVLGGDYAKAAKAAPQSDVNPVTERLIELRRSLP